MKAQAEAQAEAQTQTQEQSARQEAQIIKRETEAEEDLDLLISQKLPYSLDHIDLCGISAASFSAQALERLETRIRLEFAQGSPRADLLLGITQLNIIRALHANQKILGYTDDDMHDDALSGFNRHLQLSPSSQQYIVKTIKSELPPPLQPTAIQQTIPHHPWLDMIPIPRMRENLIRAGDTIDDVKLCHDICGYRVSETGILIWGEPWDPSTWEVTERFLQLWGWTVRDCWELFHSTNKWRLKRGERPLFAIPPSGSL